MFTKLILPIAAIVLLAFAVGFVVVSRSQPPEMPPPIEPTSSPFEHSIAGSGIVEAQTDNIEIGSNVPGIVEQVFVREGDSVDEGAPLFVLDDRTLKSQLELKQAALHAAEAQLNKLEHEPRPEQVSVEEASVREALAIVRQRQDQLNRDAELVNSQAVTREELVASQQALAAAQASLEQARARLELLKAGAWEYDLAIAQVNVEQARADIAQLQTEVTRLTTTAPLDGEILEVEVQPGEFVGTPATQTLMVLGNTRLLHVRVDIDEFDIPRFDQSATAIARRRGLADDRIPLDFVRIQPYVIPKRSLTGESTERVDTRVL
ncbi:MAG: biotin/lipoyl-binding protein, partial [Planctomycetales bacterium]|nr:biotin/lipoyl-binding protein [Planctomycetales bacterium]